jgi:hypothetical protein
MQLFSQTLQKVLKISLSGLFLAALVACGGGGASGEPAPGSTAGPSLDVSPAATPTAILTAGNTSVDTPQATQIVGVTATSSGEQQLSFSADSSLATNLTAGGVLSINQGVDPRFPLGLAGKVTNVSKTDDGKTMVDLAPATLAEIVTKSSVQANDVPLSTENFIGVISPRAVKANPATPQKLGAFQSGISALQGGVLLVNKPSNKLESLFAKAESFLGGNGSVDAGEIKLNLEIKLKDMLPETSNLLPFGSAADPKVSISGSIKDLKITENHEFEKTLGIPTGLKALNFKVTGELAAEAKLKGGFKANLGYFSNAWKEVEEAAVEKLGLSAKLSGLDSKDKVGKYPIAGLVFSVPCAATCPIVAGQNQTPLRLAQSGGVIVWIYLNANGTFTLDGATGIRVNPGQISLGMQQPEGGNLEGIGSFINKGTAPLLEAPFFDGAASLTARVGIAVDADFFAFGVRVANAELFLGSQVRGDVTATPAISYATPALTGPWAWQGAACTSLSIGGGAILSTKARIGTEISTSWGIASGTASYEKEYGGQWPSEAEINTAGWHQVLGQNAWHTAAAYTDCYPTPTSVVTGTQTVTTTTPPITTTTAAAIQQAVITQVLDDYGSSQGALAQNAITDDTTPTLNGSISAALTNGQKVNIYDGLNLFTAVAAVNGTSWTFTPPAPLPSGLHSFTAEVVNFDGTPGQRSAPFVITVLSTSITTVSPSQITRTLVGGFNIAGRDLPNNGLSVTVPGDSRATCQTPSSMTANGFSVACTLYKLGTQTLEIHSSNVLIGTVSVVVKTNVTGVSWTSPSTTSSGTVKFDETVAFKVAGVNLLADTTMGFAVQLCGVSNAEIGVPSNILRTFTCSFNNNAGAIVGLMPGVVKDAPGGQILFEGWYVAVEALVTTSKLNDTGITANQCYAIGSDVLVSCNSTAAIALNSLQDGMLGRDVTHNTDVDGRAGFSYSLVPNAAGGTYEKTECVKDNVTGLMWEGKTDIGLRANTNTYTYYSSTSTLSTDAAGYVLAVNAISLCGYTNWRLPTNKELFSIVDLSQSSSVPSIDLSWFPNTILGGYRTSEYVVPYTQAWSVNFAGGVVYEGHARSGGLYVRLVRDTQ